MAGRKIGLDYFRAAAILLVLWGHFSTRYGPPGTTFPSGKIGVELFFVLSGYLIGGIFLRSIADAGGHVSAGLVGHFWVRRWMRTLPLYLLFVAMYAVVNHFSAVQLAQFLTFTQNLTAPIPGGFAVSWSLAVEEWFYLLLPVLVLAFSAVLGKTRRPFLATVCVLMVVPTLLRFVMRPGREWDADIGRVVIFRLDAMMYGVLIAHLERFRPQWFARLRHWPVALAGAVGVAGVGCYIGARSAHGADFLATVTDLWAFTMWDVSAAMMLPFLSVVGGLGRATDGMACRISLWSYSMYLCHEPIMIVLDKLQPRLHLPNATMPVLAAVLVVAGSAALYNGFELPIMRLRDRWFSSKQAPRGATLVARPSS